MGKVVAPFVILAFENVYTTGYDFNQAKVEEINPEYMLEKSFYQFQHYRAIPGVVESKYKITVIALFS